MKKVISIILTLVLVFAVFNIASLSASATDLKVVYLDSVNGRDSNSGLTTGKAVATLYTAFAKLGAEGGIINVCGDTVIDDPALTQDMQAAPGYQLDMPAHTGKVYITSHNGSKLIKEHNDTGTVISFFGPVEMYNITIENKRDQNVNIYTYCNEFTIGMGFDAIAMTQARCPRIYGFTANPATGIEGNPIINVYSGKLGNIYGAGTAGAKAVTGNVTINVYGGTMEYVYDGGPGNVEGNTTVNIFKGATILTNVAKSGTVSGTRTLNFYNFTSTEEDALKYAAADFNPINKGLTAIVPTPASNSIYFAIETDDPNETTVTPETTEAPVTTAPVTTPVTTKAPTTTATPSTTTETPSTTTAPKKTGCGKSSSIFVALQVVLVVGSAVTFAVIKKH